MDTMGRKSRPIRRVLLPPAVTGLGGGDHPSWRRVATPLTRPTRTLGRAALNRALCGLAPSGVYRAAAVTCRAGELLPHPFTLTARLSLEAVYSLWHCPAGHPGWPLATTLLCGARTFLDQSLPCTAAARPTLPQRSWYSPSQSASPSQHAYSRRRAGAHLPGPLTAARFSGHGQRDSARHSRPASPTPLRTASADNPGTRLGSASCLCCFRLLKVRRRRVVAIRWISRPWRLLMHSLAHGEASWRPSQRRQPPRTPQRS